MVTCILRTILKAVFSLLYKSQKIYISSDNYKMIPHLTISYKHKYL